MINPDFLKTFLTLAETKHFTETARKRNMTQPGVSQHLQRLEEYFGTALVSRRGKSFTLTEEGKKLVGYAKNLFQEHSRLQERLREDDPHAGLCRFGSPGSFGLKVFDTLLEEAKKHPALKIDMLVAPTAAIVGHLKEERIDVGFMAEEPKDSAIESELFAKDELLLVLPHGKRATSWEALKAIGFVNHPDGYGYARDLLARNFPKEFAGWDTFPISVFINQLNRILDPVAEGLGFAIVPETTVRRFHRRDEITVTRLKHRADQSIYKVIRRGEKLPRRYQEILRRLASSAR